MSDLDRSERVADLEKTGGSKEGGNHGRGDEESPGKGSWGVQCISVKI